MNNVADWAGGQIGQFNMAINKWQWSFDKSFTFAVHTKSAPCWIHRVVQRYVLGIHWKRVK